MVEQPAIAGGAGVVEFVHHDVIKGVRGEAAQVADPAEGLDRGEEDIDAFVLLGAVEPAEPRLGPDPAERGHRLGQDLVPVGHEQHPGEGTAVEGGKPGLAQPGRQHDQPGPVPGGPRGGQRRQRRALDRVGFRRRGRGFVRHDLLRKVGQGCALPPGGIGGDPIRGQRARARVGPEVIECPRDGISRALGVQVPFDATGQSGAGQVRTADNCCTLPIGSPEQPGLGVETARAGLKHAHLGGFQIGEAVQRAGFGDVHVITHHHPQPPTAIQQVPKPRRDQLHARVHREGHRQIDAVGSIDALGDQRQKRIGDPGGQAQGLRAARSQVEMPVIGCHCEPRRSTRQRLAQPGQQGELLGRRQISPGCHMTRRSQRTGRATDRAVRMRVGQGASGNPRQVTDIRGPVQAG